MMQLSQLFLLLILAVTCKRTDITPLPGAARYDQYENLIKDKSICIAGNQTSVIGDVHLLDYLIEKAVDIKSIMNVYVPEHGFRGTESDGELNENGRDVKTGIPIISLYGIHKKPSSDDLKSIEVVLFDIQEVGARFYKYISNLQYIMEACAENNVKCIILDRPNPNGFYIDGNVTFLRNF